MESKKRYQVNIWDYNRKELYPVVVTSDSLINAIGKAYEELGNKLRNEGVEDFYLEASGVSEVSKTIDLT